MGRRQSLRIGDSIIGIRGLTPPPALLHRKAQRRIFAVKFSTLLARFAERGLWVMYFVTADNQSARSLMPSVFSQIYGNMQSRAILRKNPSIIPQPGKKTAVIPAWCRCDSCRISNYPKLTTLRHTEQHSAVSFTGVHLIFRLHQQSPVKIKDF